MVRCWNLVWKVHILWLLLCSIYLHMTPPSIFRVLNNTRVGATKIWSFGICEVIVVVLVFGVGFSGAINRIQPRPQSATICGWWCDILSYLCELIPHTPQDGKLHDTSGLEPTGTPRNVGAVPRAVASACSSFSSDLVRILTRKVTIGGCVTGTKHPSGRTLLPSLSTVRRQKPWPGMKLTLNTTSDYGWWSVTMSPQLWTHCKRTSGTLDSWYQASGLAYDDTKHPSTHRHHPWNRIVVL